MSQKIDQIETAKQAALNVLKPLQKDIERGLELHRDAIIVDAFSFSPTCSPDGDALRKVIEDGASDAELDLMQREMYNTRCLIDDASREEFIAAWKASGITGLFQQAGPNSLAPSIMANYLRLIDEMPDLLCRGVKAEDVANAKRSGRHCILFSSNNVPLAGDGSSVAGELRLLRTFFNLGFRQAHLSYNRANLLCDGCAEPRNAGLTEFGRAAVAAMNDAGIIVDVAHTGWRSSLEAARASRVPMIASHSACCALHEHIRGKPDDVIRAIVATGGHIGIVMIPAFLGGSGDLNALLDHVDHVAKTFGADHVAIGSDAAYRSAQKMAKLPKLRKKRPPLSNFWPAGMDLSTPDWAMCRTDSLAWTNRPYITIGLVQRGYSDDDIRKIMGGNVLRVLQAALDGRKKGW